MTPINTLTGPALRYAVAIALGYSVRATMRPGLLMVTGPENTFHGFFRSDGGEWAEHSSWAPDRFWHQTGQLIDAYECEFRNRFVTGEFVACVRGPNGKAFGIAALQQVAVCRAVAALNGDTIDLAPFHSMLPPA